ncbi:MAG: GNAT family N-acetyltransferase [Chlorobi bacterium]|nr:GNAT family N-acetyltransferase [Chlorobiota bacterium]
MKIEGSKITLNQRTLNQEEKKTLYSSNKEIDTMSEVWRYPKGTPTKIVFTIEKEGKTIGELKMKNFRWFNRKAELAMILIPEEQRKGYGTEALRMIIDYAFKDMNLHRLEGEVIEYNEASKKIIESLGFKEEGRLREAKYSKGKYWDILRYGLLASEYEK